MTTTSDVYVPSAQDLTAIAELVWASYVDGDIVVDESGPILDSAFIATVAIGGEWNGHVLIGTNSVAARRIAAQMFAMEDDEVSDAEIGDALGEMANIVGGNVKALMPEPSVLSLPQVALETRAIYMPGAVQKTQVDLRWEGAPVHISVWEGQTSNGGK
ncbi:MAG TPA: chemotaxis protein CheX [Jatrophihabitans sp.]|jgi:chemotaxis protein CheX